MSTLSALSWAIGHSSFFETASQAVPRIVSFAFDSFRTSRTGIDDQQLGRETHRTEGDIHAHYYGTCSRERARSVLHGSGFGREKSGSIGSIG
jgi:hypothetical protein